MFGLKLILTIIITLVLIFAFLGTNPAVSGFFDSISQRLPFSDNTPRNIEFSLAADKYSGFSFSVNSPVNFTITGYTEAELRTGNLRTNKTVGIYGFRGSGSIEGNKLTLDGKMSNVELPEITIAVQETIRSNSTFTSLSAAGLSIKEFKIENTSGMLTVRSASSQFSDDIEIISPLGDFGFFVNNVTFSLSGKASKISIPNAGIIIE